ncbi:chorismate mutase [Acinetobacter baumannii 1428368]|nr:chorismate mutase [Acinetobacter baumannii 1428368]
MINDDQNKTTSLSLEQIREDIDSVDQQIQELLNRRASLAEAVAKAKFASEENPLFYRPEREAQVLRKVMERNQGPLSDVTMARLFREIMSACLALEAPQSIAFLGQKVLLLNLPYLNILVKMRLFVRYQLLMKYSVK